jgi:hypothetical protein
MKLKNKLATFNKKTPFDKPSYGLCLEQLAPPFICLGTFLLLSILS